MAEDKKINNRLKNNTLSKYYFEQYKIYLNWMEKISDKRENANRYFITLNSGIFVIIWFIIENISKEKYLFIALVWTCIFGLIISIIFYFLINSYKQLNTAKFKIIHEIENDLPIKLFSREWDILGKWKDYKKYYPFSHIEKLIPFVFWVIYLLIILYLSWFFNLLKKFICKI